MNKMKLFGEAFKFSNNRRISTKNCISIIVSIITPVIIAILIAAMVGYDPFKLFVDLFAKAFIDYKTLIFNMVILGLGALSFIFAFKVGLFNIGMVGQMMTAGITCLVIALALKDVNFPNGLSQIFMLLIAIVSASVIGVLVAVLKIYLKVNEVVSSILLNWILFFLIRFLLKEYLSSNIGGNPSSSSYDFPPIFTLNIASVGGWLPALIILIIIAISVWVLFKYTVFGKKIISVGNSMSASKYLGFNTKLLLISAMAISSGIAGILGYTLYTAGTATNIPINLTGDILPIEGMNGIAIGLISMSHPIAIIPVSFIIGMFQTSAPFLDVPSPFTNFIIGLIILGSTFFIVVIKYKPWIWVLGKINKIEIEENYKKRNNDLDKLVSKYKSFLLELNSQKKNIKKDLRKNKNNEHGNLVQLKQLEYELLSINYKISLLDIEYQKEKEIIVANYIKRNYIQYLKNVFWPKEKLLQEQERNISKYNENILKRLKKIKSEERKQLVIANSNKEINEYIRETNQFIEWKIKQNNNSYKYETLKIKNQIQNLDLIDTLKKDMLNSINEIYEIKKHEEENRNDI